MLLKMLVLSLVALKADEAACSVLGCLLITGMKSYGQGRCRNGLIRLVCRGSRKQYSLNRGVGEGRAPEKLLIMELVISWSC